MCIYNNIINLGFFGHTQFNVKYCTPNLIYDVEHFALLFLNRVLLLEGCQVGLLLYVVLLALIYSMLNLLHIIWWGCGCAIFFSRKIRSWGVDIYSLNRYLAHWVMTILGLEAVSRPWLGTLILPHLLRSSFLWHPMILES